MDAIFDFLCQVLVWGLGIALVTVGILACIGLFMSAPPTPKDDEDEFLKGISKIVINIKYENDDDVSYAAQQPSSQTASSALPESEDSQNPTA